MNKEKIELVETILNINDIDDEILECLDLLENENLGGKNE